MFPEFSAVGILDHVIVIPILLQTAARDAWVSVLVSSIVLLIWIPFLYFVMKRSDQQHLFVWLKLRLGPVIAWFVLFMIIVDLFLMCAMTIRDVTFWTNMTYLPKTPNWILVILFAFVSYLAARSGLRTIAIANGVLLPFVVLLGFFVMTANFPHKDYSLLFPLFEYGHEPMLKGMVYAGSGFAEMMYFVFMQHRLKRKMKLVPLLVTGMILVELTLSPLTGAIAVFGPEEAARMRFPAYEQWRLITFGHFIEHVDFFSIYQWLVGSFIRISFGMFLITDLLRISKDSRRNVLFVLLFVLLIAVSQIPMNDKTFLALLSTFLLPFEMVFVLFLSAFLAISTWLHSIKKVKV